VSPIILNENSQYRNCRDARAELLPAGPTDRIEIRGARH
jgi:hypothetical protein